MIKKLIVGVVSLLCFSYALTFPVDIKDCMLFGKTIGVTSWFSTPRKYGQHKALDIPLPVGKKLVACEMGEIEIGQEYPKYDSTLKIWRSGYGIYVKIKTYTILYSGYGKAVKQYGNSYLYGHLDKVAGLVDGQDIGEGEVIGWSGTSGVVNEKGVFQYAPHLHFEARDKMGVKLNMTTELGKLAKAYFGSNEKYVFTLVGGGNTNN